MPQPLERDLDATRASLLAWFADVIPEGSEFAIDALRGPSDTGFSSDTLLFDLRYRQAGAERSEALVARIEPASAFPIFPSYDVALQFQSMRAMGERGVPVPTMRWLEGTLRPPRLRPDISSGFPLDVQCWPRQPRSRGCLADHP